MRMSSRRPLAAAAVAAALGLCLSLTPAAATAGSLSAPHGKHDVTTPAQAKLVDAVATPTIDWTTCGDFDCARVPLPLNYSDPEGPTVEIALIRARARGEKKATVFFNPGGPGGSGIEKVRVLVEGGGLPDAMRENFDLIGFDPRGTNGSTQVRCFRDAEAQIAAGVPLLFAGFPYTRSQDSAFIAAAEAEARGCSTTGAPLAQAATTANVARDMQVLSRAVDGDLGLTYVGYSYGSYLGQVYANMFPDRVRALLIDAIVDPVAWSINSPNGWTTKAASNMPLWLRENSDGATWRAFSKGMQLCAASADCPLERPLADFELLTRRLTETPATISGTVLSYDIFIRVVTSLLYNPGGVDTVALVTKYLLIATDPGSTPDQVGDALATVQALLEGRPVEEAATQAAEPVTQAADSYLYSFYDSQQGVVCTDPAANPASVATSIAAGRRADATNSRYFGSFWASYTLPCASNVWKQPTNNPYRGPFNRATKAPVLIFGNYYDPATHYDNAAKVHALLPNSLLVRTNAWGHTVFPTDHTASGCVADTGVAYLLDPLRKPAGFDRGGVKTCLDFPQPFGAAPTNPFAGRVPRP